MEREKPTDWQKKVQEMFQLCSGELKKTTKIGKKMFSASKANANLHEAYEELGMLVAEALKKDELQWENDKVKSLLKTIKSCESDLSSIEKQVNDIRFSDEEDTKKDS